MVPDCQSHKQRPPSAKLASIICLEALGVPWKRMAAITVVDGLAKQNEVTNEARPYATATLCNSGEHEQRLSDHLQLGSSSCGVGMRDKEWGGSSGPPCLRHEFGMLLRLAGPTIVQTASQQAGSTLLIAPVDDVMVSAICR
jgi:hypothetical protein